MYNSPKKNLGLPVSLNVRFIILVAVSTVQLSSMTVASGELLVTLMRSIQIIRHNRWLMIVTYLIQAERLTARIMLIK